MRLLQRCSRQIQSQIPFCFFAGLFCLVSLNFPFVKVIAQENDTSINSDVRVYSPDKENSWMQEIPSFSKHLLSVSHLQVAPDGETVVGSVGDGTIRIWEMQDGTEVKKKKVGSRIESAQQLTFSPDGKFLLGKTGYRHPQLEVWEYPSLKGVFRKPIPNDTGWTHDRVFALSKQQAKQQDELCFRSRSLFAKWSFPNGDQLASRKLTTQESTFPIRGLSNAVEDSDKQILFAKFVKRIVNQRAMPGEVIVQNLCTEKETNKFLIEELEKTDRVQLLSLSPDAKQLMLFSIIESTRGAQDPRDREKMRVTAFDVQTGKQKWSQMPHLHNISCAVFSPCGKYLATAGRQMEGETVAEFSSDEKRTFQTTWHFNRRGKLIELPIPRNYYQHTWNSIHLWDTSTGKLLGVIPHPQWNVGSVTFSPDSKSLLIGASQVFHPQQPIYAGILAKFTPQESFATEP